jgi:transcriptional regulator with XRE-family HTH domain
MRISHIRQGAHITEQVKKHTRLTQQKRLLTLLRSARIDAGLTQAQLAARLDQDQTFVSKYESAERRLDILELREVCQAIGIDFMKFIGRLDQELRLE